MDVKEIKKKIQHLRNYYVKELSKNKSQQPSGAGTENCDKHHL